jgi:acetyl esterase/lipase
MSIDLRRRIPFANHDGVELTGDLFMPAAEVRHPTLVAVHGGGWQVGTSEFFQYWGPYLAERGTGLFAINYRLAALGKKAYPEAVRDVRAAIQFLRGQSEQLKVDTDRIGLIGDSAGAHLAALVALAGDKEHFSTGAGAGTYAALSTRVRVCIGIYGVYDMASQWMHDLTHRPYDNIAEKFLGRPLVDDRHLYFDASPLSHATRDRNATAFLLAWGTADDTVDPRQSENFLLALKQGGYFVRPVIIPGAPHFWAIEPIEGPESYAGFLAPRLVRFLLERL